MATSSALPPTPENRLLSLPCFVCFSKYEAGALCRGWEMSKRTETQLCVCVSSMCCAHFLEWNRILKAITRAGHQKVMVRDAWKWQPLGRTLQSAGDVTVKQKMYSMSYSYFYLNLLNFLHSVQGYCLNRLAGTIAGFRCLIYHRSNYQTNVCNLCFGFHNIGISVRTW